MGYIKAILDVIVGLFSWVNKRSDLANREDMVKAKKAQQEQADADYVNRLHQLALHGTAVEKRHATAELRRLQSE